VKSFSKG